MDHFLTERHRDTNLGLCLLRMLMCFEVICCHFLSEDNYSIITSWVYLLRNYAVLVFLFMSFFLGEKNLIKKDCTYIKTRLWRLAWPLIGWGAISWMVMIAADFCFGEEYINGVSDLFWQIFTGHSKNIAPQLWYQVVLIFLTVLIMVLLYICPRRSALICMCILLIAALVLQYTTVNYYLFSPLRYELRYPLGRFCEMLPYAVTGFGTRYYRIDLKLAGKRKRYIVLMGVIAVISAISHILIIEKQFGYAGITGIFFAFSVTLFAWLLPLESLSDKMKNIIACISKYTLGIYGAHMIVGKMFIILYKAIGFRTRTILMCILIYIACYIMCAVIYRLPHRLCRQLVS